MLLSSAIALATLASTSLATSCSQSPTNFLLYTTVTGETLYGALGSPCQNGHCGVFFSVNSTTITTHYSLNSAGRLTIAAQEPSHPVGFLAYANIAGDHTNGPNSPTQVLFGRRKYIESFKPYNPLSCSIQPSPLGDGTCDLNCAVKVGASESAGQFVATTNSNQWSLGIGTDPLEDVPFVPKVQFQ